MPAIGGAGERAFLVAEDLALEPRLGNGRAVDGHEGKRRAGAELVNRLRHQFFSCTRLAGDEHGRAGRRGLFDDLVNLSHFRGVADHRAERAVLSQLAPQRLDLAARFLTLNDLVEENLEPLQVDRLGQIVVRAFLHRLDCGLDRSLRGEEQRGDIRALLLQRAQEIEAVHAWHDEIVDDNRRPERRHPFERLLAVAGRFRDKAPALDELLEAFAGGTVVLDDQHAFRNDIG